MNMPTKGCWTCKDRKVRCDRGLPRCLNCVRLKRDCRGYGVRLSWPTQGDEKRAIVVVPSSGRWTRLRRSSKVGFVGFVNASFWDIEMHNHVTINAMRNMYSQNVTAPSPFTRIVPWCPHELEATENELVSYFSSVAGSSLAAFGQDSAAVKGAIIRMALAENTPSSTAVLQCILAYSRVHRDGCQLQTHRHIGLALRNLASSATGRMSKHQASQHMTAGMLLCSGHILRDWDSTYEWLRYMCNAKDVANSASFGSIDQESDISLVLRWVYYHDVLSRFSLRHWRLRRSVEAAYFKDFHKLAEFRKPLNLPNPSKSPYKILYLLLQVFTTITDSSDPRYHSEGYRQWINILKWSANNFSTMKVQHQEDRIDVEVITNNILELYKLATLIYLERQSANLSGKSAEIESWTDRAFPLLEQLSGLDQPFPLFILGCEARTDEQRGIILELVSRTELVARSRNLQYVAHIIRSSWVQDDLTDGTLDYGEKLECIFGSTGIVPSFA